jgi:hypothetical protein
MSVRPLLSAGGSLALLCSPPVMGPRISLVIKEECEGGGVFAEKLQEAESAFFAQPLEWNWDGANLSNALESQGFKTAISVISQKEERLVGPKDISAWFDKENSRWGAFMWNALSNEDFFQIEKLLRQRVQSKPLPWKWKSLLITAS